MGSVLRESLNINSFCTRFFTHSSLRAFRITSQDIFLPNYIRITDNGCRHKLQVGSLKTPHGFSKITCPVVKFLVHCIGRVESFQISQFFHKFCQ